MNITLEDITHLIELCKENNIKVDFRDEVEPISRTMAMNYSAVLYVGYTLEQIYKELEKILKANQVAINKKEFTKLKEIYEQ